MAVLSNTGAPVVPLVGTEQTVATIAPGAPLDSVTVYVTGGTGGGGGLLEFALYAEVGGFQTRVAQKQTPGSNTASIIDWDTGIAPLDGGGGTRAQNELIDAGGTNYTVTVIDLSTGFPPAGSPPRQAVTVTIAGVATFDTVADQNFGALLGPIAPGTTAFLSTFGGYAQFMDVAIDQTNLPPVTVTLAADCGGGSVQAIVESVNLTGVDSDIAAVFRKVQLPVATRYFVSVTNKSSAALSVTLTGVTYSLVPATAGGVVTLNGDVIGPSNANTVIKWDNIPLLMGGAPGFGTPVDAAIPIYDLALNEWRTFALSGGATMTNAGVVTVNAASITLGGDVTGPASANTVVKWDNVPLLLGAAPGFTTPADAAIAIYDLGANEWRTFAMSGDATMTNAGVVTVTGAGVTLVGNANGPAGANTVQQFVTSTTNADVTVASQPNPHGFIYEGLNGLTANRTVNLNPAFVSGDQTIVKDEDGSLTGFNIILNPGGGNTIDGAATYTMTAAQNGVKGSITLVRISATAWVLV